MRTELKVFLYIIALTIVVILGLLLPQYQVPIPAFWPFGLSFIAILFIADLTVMIWRAKSSHVITNVGHWSICSKKDIHHISWHNDFITVKDEHNKSLGELTLMFPGGIDYIANIPSNSEYPVLIFPSIYEEIEGECYHVHANLYKYILSELSPYLRYVLERTRFKKRVKRKTTIYYGVTSHMNLSDIPTNLKIELQEKKGNEFLTNLEDINTKLYDQFDKKEKRKIKNIFVKETGEIEEP